VLLKGLGKTEQEGTARLMDTEGAGFLSNGKNVPVMATMFEKAGEYRLPSPLTAWTLYWTRLVVPEIWKSLSVQVVVPAGKD